MAEKFDVFFSLNFAFYKSGLSLSPSVNPLFSHISIFYFLGFLKNIFKSLVSSTTSLMTGGIN